LTVVDPLTPPATSTTPFESSVAVWPCTGAGIAVVAANVEPFQSSAVPSDALPFDPPATSTCPVPRGVAVWSWRAVVRFPEAVHVPWPDDGLKTTVVFRVVVPVLPPVTSTLPFDSTVAVCPSLAAGSCVTRFAADQVVPLSTCTTAVVDDPELPPTTMTVLLSAAFPGTDSSVAVWFVAALAIWPVAVQLPVPLVGL
jgi:hypothetical protein